MERCLVYIAGKPEPKMETPAGDQTCCGQPMANSGCFQEAQATEELFIRNFSTSDTRSSRCQPNKRLANEVNGQSALSIRLQAGLRSPADG
jgi:hypothetical protein